LAAVAIIIQKQARLACLLLAGMLILFVLTMHLPALGGDMQSAMRSLLKDTALAGAALGFAGSASE
jgi:putative oxidoreductase